MDQLSPEERREKHREYCREYHKRTYADRREEKNRKRQEWRRQTNWYEAHAEEQNANRKAYYQEHKEEERANARARHAALRLAALQHYGGQCACCGETELKFLSIDHINNDGAAHRRQIGHSGKAIYTGYETITIQKDFKCFVTIATEPKVFTACVRINEYTMRKEYKKQYYAEHKETIKARSKKYYEAHREEQLAKEKARNAQNRDTVLHHYGARCVCCGETELQFLTIDRSNGNSGRGAGSSLYSWIVKNNFPDNFQVLCRNCNMAKGLYGFCPHQEKEFASEPHTAH